MSLYIPVEIGQEIQDFLDAKTMITSLLISKSFSKPKLDNVRVYKYRGFTYEWNSTEFSRVHHVVPKWVMKVKLNENTFDEDLKNCGHIKWLHLGRNHYVDG